jgi:hypothetical protein
MKVVYCTSIRALVDYVIGLLSCFNNMFPEPPSFDVYLIFVYMYFHRSVLCITFLVFYMHFENEIRLNIE